MTRRPLRIVHDGECCNSPPVPDHALVPSVPESVVASPALHGVLERGLSAVVALTGARGGAIRLIPPDAAAFRLVSAVGLPSRWIAVERVAALDCGVCGAALKADGTQLRREPICARRLEPGPGESPCGPVLAVPLHCRGRPIGVFNLFFGGATRVPEDLGTLLAPAAQMLDLVLENAVLEQERLRSSLVAERQMLAGEVHDSLAQGLAFIRMRLPLLDDAIRAHERDHALKYFHDVSDAVGDAHARLRELITQFRHAVDQGLLQALETSARTFQDRTGVALRIENRVADLRLPPNQEVQVYQIVQEALANVVKHAGARNARIVIDRRAGRVRLGIEDDGCGTARKAWERSEGEHYGVDIMRERADRIGAHLEIRSVAGKGTRVRVILPPEQPEP